MTDSLKHKEDLAIKLLKQIPSDDIELCYSGGKDSDVILYLARLAGIPFTAIYKNTTIDPAGTIKHCQDNGVEIHQPKQSFFDIIERKGFPTRRARFCCSELKEYKIKDHAILGIRRSESTARAKRYQEPQICCVYSAKSKCKQYLPILFWSYADVAEYIKANNIQLHPLYYDQDGNLDVKQRLGCMGCPMQSDCGLKDFKQHPQLVKQWLKHGKVWWDTHPNAASHNKFPDIYSLFAHNIFYRSYQEWQNATFDRLFGDNINWEQKLEDYFGITL